LGDQRLRALAGAVELEHVCAEVVALDDARQRPALAQRHQVAGRGDARQTGQTRWHTPKAIEPPRESCQSLWMVSFWPVAGPPLRSSCGGRPGSRAGDGSRPRPGPSMPAPGAGPYAATV